MTPFEKLTIRQSEFFDFGDERLNNRAAQSLKSLINSNPLEGFPRIFKNQYELKGFYRLMNNNKVTPEKISNGFGEGLKCILREQAIASNSTPKVYYQYQDTTYGSYLHRKETLDLGYIENKTDNGVVIHTSILTDSSYTPLGIPFQQQILRDRQEYQKAHQRKKRPFTEKESFKWVASMAWSAEIQKELNVRIIHVADREGDMSELFNYAFENDLDFIVRCRHNRLLPQIDQQTNDEGQKKFWQYLRSQPAKTKIDRQLLDSNGHPYTAKCEIFWTTVLPKGVIKPIQVVYLRQIEKFQKGQATEWAIYTSLPVELKKHCIQVLDIYTNRWRTCEDFHKCLKSGCSIEKRQFESAHAMTNCIAMLSLTALHLLRMRHLATLNDSPVEEFLTQQEAKLAQILADKYLKPIDLTICQPKTVLWLVLIIGRMGGHQGFKQKGLPGWKTLWLGWSDFKKLMDGIILSMNFFKPT